MQEAPSEQARLARFESATSQAMVALSLAVIPVYVAQALADDADVWVTRSLSIARLCIQITMGIDVSIRTYLAPRRASYLATHKLDLLAAIVPPLRAVREVVTLRSILSRPGIARFTTFGLAVIVGCALVVYASEHDRDGASIQSVGDAFWWATVTTTTVGYGDEVPITGQGRAMAVLLMFLGVALLAVLTAHIAAHFVDDGREPNSTELLNRLDRLDATLALVETQLRQLATADQAPAISLPPSEDRQ